MSYGEGAWKLSEDVCGIRVDCTLIMSCRGRIWVSLSEGNAKTCLEQSPVTDSPKAYGPHKSTVTTQRKSVLSVLSVVKKTNNKHFGDWKVITSQVPASTPVPRGHYSE